MLHIISGKFFGGGELLSFPGKGGNLFRKL
jgi:hypothetical protein